MDRFAQILYDLGKEIGVDLYPDPNRICQVNYDEKLHLQLQYDETKEMLLIATFVCEVPAGKYREKLLKEGLAHNREYPRIGTLAYSERNNQLTLFENLHAPGLKTQALFDFLVEFVEEALAWKDAVENGRPLPTSQGSKETGGDNIFGMKP